MSFQLEKGEIEPLECFGLQVWAPALFLTLPVP
jgi:hypothetical protein